MVKFFTRRDVAFVGLIVCAILTSGCAGLDVEWEARATYQTEELREKRRQLAAEALDRAADVRKQAEVARAMQP